MMSQKPKEMNDSKRWEQFIGLEVMSSQWGEDYHMSTELISSFYNPNTQNSAVKVKVNQKEIQLISGSQGTRKHFGSVKEG